MDDCDEDFDEERHNVYNKEKHSGKDEGSVEDVNSLALDWAEE